MKHIFDFKMVFTNIPKLLQYLPTTLEIAVIAYFASLIVGFLVALVKIKKTKVLYQIVSFYVSFCRGTPIIVQLYATYFGIPMVLQLINARFGTHLSSSFIPNIIFAKNEEGQKLANAVDGALRTLKENGKLNEISQKWLGYDVVR